MNWSARLIASIFNFWLVYLGVILALETLDKYMTQWIIKESLRIPLHEEINILKDC